MTPKPMLITQTGVPTIAAMVEYIGSKHMLRIEQWQDGSAWRVGINWYSADRYDYVCEQPTLAEALEYAIAHESSWSNKNGHPAPAVSRQSQPAG